MIISDVTLAKRYEDNWLAHWNHSVEFVPETADPESITPEEAVNREGRWCTVEMQVAVAHDAGNNFFLNSPGYKVPGNLAIMVTADATPTDRFKGWGEFVNYLEGIRGKKVKVWGKVTDYQGSKQIVVTSPTQFVALP